MKNNKILLISVFILLLGLGIGLGIGGILLLRDKPDNDKSSDNNVSDKINDESILEQLRDSLSDYINKYTSSTLGCVNCGEFNIINPEFKCDVLKEHNIIELTDYYMVLDDYSLYNIDLYGRGLYANEQHCMKEETTISVVEHRFNNGKMYYYDSNKNGYYVDSNSMNFRLNNNLTNKNSNLIYYYSDYDNGRNIYGYRSFTYTIRDDGSLYKKTYNLDTDKVVSDEVLIDSSKYGKVLNARFDRYKDPKSSFDDKVVMLNLITDKGYYYTNPVNLSVCKNNDKFNCGYELKESEVYKKY